MSEKTPVVGIETEEAEKENTAAVSVSAEETNNIPGQKAENASKGEKCCITIEELYERIKNW